MNKDLFGNEVKSEYTQFVEKFETKLTTDDCYTPPAVYEFVRNYVCEQCGISKDARIMRPFRPNGDYQAEDYSGNCVVIDNPPFSIISKICRYYEEKGVQYFLFAPALTLFGVRTATTKIVASCEITYENGATVRTSFVSNMFGDLGLIADPVYRREILKLQRADKPKLPKYRYPDNVLTVGRLQKMVERGGSFKVRRSAIHRVAGLDDQKRVGKAIFGSGYLIGDNTAEELRAEELRAEELRAEELRAEELRAEELRAEELRAEDDVIEWRLSNQERAIIEAMGGG